jgi:hypothetical protein
MDYTRTQKDAFWMVGWRRLHEKSLPINCLENESDIRMFNHHADALFRFTERWLKREGIE